MIGMTERVTAAMRRAMYAFQYGSLIHIGIKI